MAYSVSTSGTLAIDGAGAITAPVDYETYTVTFDNTTTSEEVHVEPETMVDKVLRDFERGVGEHEDWFPLLRPETFLTALDRQIDRAAYTSFSEKQILRVRGELDPKFRPGLETAKEKSVKMVDNTVGRKALSTEESMQAAANRLRAQQGHARRGGSFDALPRVGRLLVSGRPHELLKQLRPAGTPVPYCEEGPGPDEYVFGCTPSEPEVVVVTLADIGRVNLFDPGVFYDSREVTYWAVPESWAKKHLRQLGE